MENGARPERVRESHARREQGIKRERREHRPFYCRSCGREEHGTHVPGGWYSIMRHSGSKEPGERLGVYCSAVCAELAMPRLEAVQERIRQEAALGRA